MERAGEDIGALAVSERKRRGLVVNIRFLVSGYGDGYDG